MDIACKRCGSTDYKSAGKIRGKSRYHCKGCHYNFVRGDARKGRYEEEKKEAIKLYVEGMGFRAIGRFLGVSNVSVLRWIRAAGEKIKTYHEENKKSRTKEVKVIELDEMHHYVKKKKGSAGFGLDLTEQKES